MSTDANAKQATVARWAVLIIGLAVLWIAFLMLFGPIGGSGDLPPELVGTGTTEPADYAWKLTDLDGQSLTFERFRGRPDLLNIWATWCPPCREEMPSLARLADDARIKRAGVAVVCVSVDDSPEPVRTYLSDKKFVMTMLHAPDGALPGVFRTDGIPATFLIAPDGRITAQQLGGAEWDNPQVIDTLVGLAPKP